MSVLSAAVFSFGTILANSHTLKMSYLVCFVLLCLLLSVSGDSIDYVLGKYATKWMSKFVWFQRTFPTEQLVKGHRWIKKYGGSAIFISRYLPGLRTVTSYVAGGMEFPYLGFFLCNVVANGLMLILCATIGYFLGTIPFVKAHYILIISCAIVTMSLPTLVITFKKITNNK